MIVLELILRKSRITYVNSQTMAEQIRSLCVYDVISVFLNPWWCSINNRIHIRSLMSNNPIRYHAQRSSLTQARPSYPLACACYHSGEPAPLVCQALFCTRSCRIVVESSVWFRGNLDLAAISSRGSSPSVRQSHEVDNYIPTEFFWSLSTNIKDTISG